jgi:hypothetical protein
VPKVKQKIQEIESYRETLFTDTPENLSVKAKISDLEEQVKSLKDKLDLNSIEIQNYYNKIFIGNEENSSFKEDLDGYIEEIKEASLDIESKKDSLNKFYDKVFGVTDSEGLHTGGLEIELDKYESKYKALFSNIEHLLPGATSAGLAKVFGDKVIEYEKESDKWKWISFAILLILTGFYLFWGPKDSKTIEETVLHLLDRLPFIIFAIWLLKFTGNRRAENKKLAESYKHKEVMARSFVGYKEQIKDLGESDTDLNLLTTHMSNLLRSINVNSADFLNKEGEKSPAQEILKSFFSKDKK